MKEKSCERVEYIWKFVGSEEEVDGRKGGGFGKVVTWRRGGCVIRQIGARGLED